MPLKLAVSLGALILLAAEAAAQQPPAPAAPSPPASPPAPEAAGPAVPAVEMMHHHGRHGREAASIRIRTDELSVDLRCSYRETADQCAEVALRLVDGLTDEGVGTDRSAQ